MNKKYRKLEEVEIEHFKNNPKEIIEYLDTALREYDLDGDGKAFLSSLRVVAEAMGGMTKLSKQTGLNRENLYRVLSSKGNPEFSTIIHILHSFGLSIKLTKKAA